MCEPMTILATTAVISAAVGAYGAIEQGKSARYAADYQAKVAENNATMADYQAQDVARKGEDEAVQVQRAYASRLAAGRTGFAAGNVALDSGSAGLWQVGTETSRAEDLATVKTNTQNDVWATKYQAQNLRSEAGALRIGGRNQQSGSYISAAGSLLQGATTLASANYMRNR